MTIQELHYLFRVKYDRLDNKYYSNFTSDEIDLLLNDAQRIFIKTRMRGHEGYNESFEQTQKRQNDLKEIITGDTALLLSSSQAGVKPGGYYYDLPADYLYAFQEEAEISYLNCHGTPSTTRKGFVGVTHAKYLLIKDDPFNRPNVEDNFGLRLISNNKIEALTFGEFTINYYYMRYVRTPRIMQYSDNTPIPNSSLVIGKRYKVLSGSIVHNGSTITVGQTFIAQNNNYSGVGTVVLDGVDCELNEDAQREIVNIAVNNALDIAESQRASQYQQKVLQQE